MNKYFVWACLAGVFMWSVTSCSEQTMMDQGIHASGEAQREVQITFHLSVISGMQTRGGRPLYSSEALQMVNDMKVYVFKKDANTVSLRKMQIPKRLYMTANIIQLKHLTIPIHRMMVKVMRRIIIL